MATTFRKPDHVDGHRPARPSIVPHLGVRSVGTHKFNASRASKVTPPDHGDCSAANAAFNNGGVASGQPRETTRPDQIVAAGLTNTGGK